MKQMKGEIISVQKEKKKVRKDLDDLKGWFNWKFNWCEASTTRSYHDGFRWARNSFYYNLQGRDLREGAQEHL